MDYTVAASGVIAAEGTNVTTRSFTLPTVADGQTLVVGVGLASSGAVTLTGAGVTTAAPTGSSTRSGFGTHAWLLPLSGSHSGTTVTITTASSLKVATVWAVLNGVSGVSGSVSSTNNTGGVAMTPPAFTPGAGVGLLHVAAIATASNPPPTSWTPPSPMAVQQFVGTGGTTGRAGAALAVLTADQTAISGNWSANVANSWGIVAIPVTIVPTGTTPTGGSTTGVQVSATTSSFAWLDQAAADTLASPSPSQTLASGTASQTAGAVLVEPSDARLRYRGASGFAYGTTYPDTLCYQPSSRYPYGWGNPPTFGVEFDHTGSVFEVRYKYLSPVGASWMRISVNGQRLTDAPVRSAATSGGSIYTHRVTFPSSATRRILLEFERVPFAGIYLPNDGTTIANPGPFKRRVLFEGDSITAGSAENSGVGVGTWYARLAKYAGIDDPWNVAIGGTGMTEPGTATTIPGRIAQVTSVTDVDDIFLWCGGNDGSTSIVTQATQYIADIKAAHPQAKIYVIGTWAPTVTPSTARAARSVDLQNAALANGVPFISPITGEVRDGAGTLLASQGPWISTSGQVAAYVGSDNVHPTDAGHAYIAQRMAQAVAAIPSAAGTKVMTSSSAAGAAVGVVGAGRKVAAASSTAGVSVTAPGTGRKGATGSSTASVSVAAAGVGRRRITGSSAATITATPSGVGVKVGRGGTAVATSVAAVGAGQRVEAGQGGSNVTVTIGAVGSGRANRAGTSIAGVGVAAVGLGHRVESGAGGGVTTVQVQAVGNGRAVRASGSVVTVSLTAVGSGLVPGEGRDITITLGPPTRRRLDIGYPTRRPLAIGNPRRQQ